MPPHRSRAGRGAAAAVVLLGTIAAAGAAPGAARASAPGEIVLGDIVVFRLRVPSGAFTAEQRADKVQERLVDVLSIPDLRAKDVCLRPTNYGPTIYVRQIKILTIGPLDAQAAGMDPWPLARKWAHRLMGVLPQVNIRLPAGAPAAPAPAAGLPPAPDGQTPPATDAPAPAAPTPTPTPPAPNP